MSILEVQDVSIRYMMGDFKESGIKEYVMRRLTHNYKVVEFWADRDITFSLEKGDMLGIIGTNGAGKSTLLKVISGIMEPTKGWVKRQGNIAALLELASGFDGDLTVRENTYLRGAMLGYTRKFMDETYQQIIAFAELEDFQDRTFKQLSSGMKSRLAFSIASLVQPDILILDEVLAVGDGKTVRTVEVGARTEIDVAVGIRVEDGIYACLGRHIDGSRRQACILIGVVWGIHLQMLLQYPVKGIVIAEGDRGISLELHALMETVEIHSGYHRIFKGLQCLAVHYGGEG